MDESLFFCGRLDELYTLCRMPVADYGDYEEIPLSPRMPVADCGDYEEIPL